jgi:hypothetical protein
MHQFLKFTPAWNSTCFGQFLCPSSWVYSLYTRHWYMSYKSEDSFGVGPSWSCSKAVFKPVWHIPVPNVQWINSWWGAEELPERCRVSCRSKFGKSMHLGGFVIKKYGISVCGPLRNEMIVAHLRHDIISKGSGCSPIKYGISGKAWK